MIKRVELPRILALGEMKCIRKIQASLMLVEHLSNLTCICQAKIRQTKKLFQHIFNFHVKSSFEI
ncbi:hypothetical protein DP117_02255 [Brasilonema sp. UFV-L1]|nr:hypothetical protein [Brasilonema sp. UFV-L1]